MCPCCQGFNFDMIIIHIGTLKQVKATVSSNGVCHVWCNFEPGYKCWSVVIFVTLKDDSL